MVVYVQITENNVEIFELIENLSILSIKEQICKDFGLNEKSFLLCSNGETLSDECLVNHNQYLNLHLVDGLLGGKGGNTLA